MGKFKLELQTDENCRIWHWSVWRWRAKRGTGGRADSGWWEATGRHGEDISYIHAVSKARDELEALRDRQIVKGNLGTIRVYAQEKGSG